jgi:hypothetical protein
MEFNPNFTSVLQSATAEDNVYHKVPIIPNTTIPITLNIPNHAKHNSPNHAKQQSQSC